MSAATTSYHLTTLQQLGIVDFERYDHRFYYHLNKDKLKELFNEAMKAFMHE
jgi:DNA-binding transcriptional ArsR family regulator